MLDDWLADQLEIFFGRATEVVTDVYLRLPRQTPQNRRLEPAGWIQGPFCEGVRTLPGKTRFLDLGPGPTFLARASVPDLAFWSPGHPYLYRVSVELYESGTCVASTELEWGCHRLSVAGPHILQGPRPMPLVAVHAGADAIDWHVWSSLEVAALIEDPREAFLQQADRHGVPVVCYTEREGDELLQCARRWARHPAAWLLVTRWWPAVPWDPAQYTPNLIWATWCHDLRQGPETDLSGAVLYEPISDASLEKALSKPVILVKPRDKDLSDITRALQFAVDWRMSWDRRWAGLFLW